MVCVVVSADRHPPLNATVAEFGARVRARREALGLTQEQAAERIGVHFTNLGLIERGRRSARTETIARIAAGLDTTVGALMDDLPLAAPE
ncbi:helix-turn-helix transcriptional regulator [Tsukamurella paurometabola]|uniref:Helix-turn-helix transcriptional regulator n=1 Tax=Tsukamurella paurometabola TaxID=2061 RepID=A0ABS5NHC4_TSUPA|nr:helix-turn-helix transcriptional regulator [Tsukamurella paurometabola]